MAGEVERLAPVRVRHNVDRGRYQGAHGERWRHLFSVTHSRADRFRPDDEKPGCDTELIANMNAVQ